MSEHHHHHHDHHDHHGVPSAEEALALLKYMIDHNEHHNEELLELSKAFPEAVQETIKDAVAVMSQGCEKLREALKQAEK